MNILVTGANGFVGKALIERLLENGHKVTGLVRSLTKQKLKSHENLSWIEGDLLDSGSLPKIGTFDQSYFLVHGLMSSERQFEYDESKTAVNFVNWIKNSGSGIIYLGAISDGDKNLSPHLRSRGLTGAILGASSLPTIEFRASIVIGEGSLSFEMIKAIVERFLFLPQMNLLSHPCQPIGLGDLLKYLESAAELKITGHEIIEIGGPDVVTYGELLELYAELSGVKRVKVKIPEVEPKVLIKALEYSVPEHSKVGSKLTESLGHATIVKGTKAKDFFPEIVPINLRTAMDLARAASTSVYPPVWEKDFIKKLLSDKILIHSGLLSPEILKNIEKIGKIKSLLSKR